MINLFFIGLILGLGSVNCGSLQYNEEPSLIRSINSFSNNFRKEYFNNEINNNEGQRNYVMSEFCAFLPLFVLCRGAENSTKNQLNNVLNTDCQSSAQNVKYVNLYSQFNDIRTATVRLASGIFVSKKYPLRSEFKENEREILSYTNLQESMNFEDGDESARVINDWIRNKTDNFISDVVQPGDFDALTAYVLANTLYFKAEWQYEFDRLATQNGIFTNIKGEKQNVPFMTRINAYRTGYVSELGAKFIELPFKGREFSFVVFLPEVNESLSALEEKLGEFDIVNILKIENGLTVEASHDVESVELYLPKFNVTSSIELKSIFKKLGLENLINKEGDLSKMLSEKLFLSKAEQNVGIEVNENGVSAAAATVVVVSAVTTYPELRVDRPFSFVIRHHATGINLFTGSVRSL